MHSIPTFILADGKMMLIHMDCPTNNVNDYWQEMFWLEQIQTKIISFGC